MEFLSRALQGVFGRRSHDVEPPEPEAPAVKIQPTIPSLYPAVGPTRAHPVAAPLRFDERTKALLLSLIVMPPPRRNADGELAQALLLCEAAPMSIEALDQYRAVVQRVTLVARMIDTIESDASVPERLKPAFGRLRFTLIKSALADPTFLRDSAHPLRTVACDLAMRAAIAGAWDQNAEREFGAILENAVRDYDLNASFVRPTVSRLRPLPLEEIKCFLQQVQAERDARLPLLATQEQVRAEIARRVKNADLAPELRQVLDTWAAVLVCRLMKRGAESIEYLSSLDVVDELMRHAPALQAGASAPKELLHRLESGLAEAGRRSDSVMEAFAALRSAAELRAA